MNDKTTFIFLFLMVIGCLIGILFLKLREFDMIIRVKRLQQDSVQCHRAILHDNGNTKRMNQDSSMYINK